MSAGTQNAVRFEPDPSSVASLSLGPSTKADTKVLMLTEAVDPNDTMPKGLRYEGKPVFGEGIHLSCKPDSSSGIQGS